MTATTCNIDRVQAGSAARHDFHVARLAQLLVVPHYSLAAWFMNREYVEYLLSDAWKAKRLQRLELSGHKCESCGRTKRLEIHHLTYARIFKEALEDLIVLCERHHKLVEEIIRTGEIARRGDPILLRNQTLLLLRGSCVKEKRKRDNLHKRRKQRTWQLRNGRNKVNPMEIHRLPPLISTRPLIRKSPFAGLKRIASDSLISVNGALVQPDQYHQIGTFLP
jgi:hypothetical protein